MLILVAGFCFLAWYSSTLKHKLDGYSRMNYADDDENYTVSVTIFRECLQLPH